MKLSDLSPSNVQVLTSDELLALHRGVHRAARASGDVSLLTTTHDLLVSAMESKSLNHNSPFTPQPVVQSGLYLKSPHGILIYDGKKTAIAQSKLDDSIPGEHIICSKEDGKGLAFGIARIDQPITVPHAAFNDYFDKHRVTIAECEKWWADCTELYVYPFTFKPYPAPRPIEIEPGVQMIMDEVKFIEEEPKPEPEPVEQKLVQEEQPMPWKPSDAESHTREANTPAKQAQWAEVANSARERCMKGKEDTEDNRNKCDASAIRQANAVVAGTAGKADDTDATNTVPQQTPQEILHPDTAAAKAITRKEMIALRDILDATLKATEPDQSTCTCPNCGAEADHESGTPCNEVECPDCGAMMRGGGPEEDKVCASDKPKPDEDEDEDKKKKPKPEDEEDEQEKSVTSTQPAVILPPEPEPDVKSLSSLLTRVKDNIAKFLGLSHESEPMHTFQLLSRKDGTGPTYMLMWTTNSYRDREGEAFAISAIKDYVDRYANEPTKGEFWYSHLPGSKFGTIIWQDTFADRFLVQLGTFDSTPIGNAFKSFFTAHPDGHPTIAPNGWGASHGYNYVAEDRVDSVYDWFNTIESSVLPMHRAANIHNPNPTILGGKDMNEKARAELRTISQELGTDLESLINATAEQRKSELDSVVEHKATDAVSTEPVPETPAVVKSEVPPDTGSTTEKVAQDQPKEQAKETLTDEQIAAVITKAHEVFGLASLSEMLAQHTAQLEALTKQQGETNAAVAKLAESDEKKIEDKVSSLPNFGTSFSWLRPSQATQTLLTDSDKTLQQAASQGKVPEALARLAQSQTR